MRLSRAVKTIIAGRPAGLSGIARARGGNAAVEFALVAPVLGAALVAMVDLGIGIYQKMEVSNAAQAGAEYAAVKGFDSNAIAGAVTGATTLGSIAANPAPVKSCGCVSGTTIASAACGANCPGGLAAGTYVTVAAQTQYATILSYPGAPSPWTLSAQTTVRIK